MCAGTVLQWACGNKIVLWNVCHKGDHTDNRPCDQAVEDQSDKIEHDHCCSTSCCQMDIDAKVRTAVDMENNFRNLLRKAGREGISPALRTDLAAEIAEENSERTLRDCLRFHLYGCVLQVDVKCKIRNRDRVMNKLAPKLPWELRIPTHREISSKDRDEFERMLDDWENSEFVKSERAFYYDHLDRQRRERKWHEQEQRRQQWEQESRWLDSNMRAVQEYRQSPARHRYRPILPANDIPPLFAPGARGSSFRPQTEDSPNSGSSMDILSFSSSEPSTPSRSRSSYRSLSQAGGSLAGTNPQINSRAPTSSSILFDRYGSRGQHRGAASFHGKTNGTGGMYRWR